VIFYTLSIYNLNAYTDYEYDSHNPRLKKLGNIKKWQYGTGVIVLFIACELIFYKLNIQLVWTGLAGFGLWCLYYLPRIKLKAVMLGGTFIHLIGGMLHFHFGWLAFKPVSAESVLCSLHVSLLLCAGHINHETIDYESDKEHGIKTTTVRIGVEKAWVLHIALFTASAITWICLYMNHYMNMLSFLTLLSAYVVSAAWRLRAGILNRKIQPEQWQMVYRYCFATAAGVLIFEKIIWI